MLKCLHHQWRVIYYVRAIALTFLSHICVAGINAMKLNCCLASPCPLVVYSSYLHNHINLFTHSIPSHFEVAKIVITSKALKMKRKNNSHIWTLYLILYSIIYRTHSLSNLTFYIEFSIWIQNSNPQHSIWYHSV